MNNISTEELLNLEQAADSESALPPNQPSIVRVGDTLICSGSVPMPIPQAGAHVRQVAIRLPLFAQKPCVTATFYSPESVGSAFVIFNIQVDKLSTNQTQVKISAGNIQGAVDVTLPYFCDYVVIGKAA